MNGTVAVVAAQIHFWPWSVGIQDETMDLTGGTVCFPFFGSPVISLDQKTTLLLASRLEHFNPLGPPYPDLDAICQVYETPHGVLTGPANMEKLRLLNHRASHEVFLIAEGAAERFWTSVGTTQQGDSPIARHVLAWSQLFDDLLEQGRKAGEYSNEVTWSEVLGQLLPLSAPNQPRMALIVHIALRMRRRLQDHVATMRRILLRERELVPLHRIQETDSTCLRWYARQPGNTTPEKAGPKQRLLGVVRKDSCDTLENRILKDFILRCGQEAARYLEGDVGDSPVLQASTRAREVSSYKNVCSMCSADPVFEPINLPTPGTPPNYVLQNDLRYREVWKWYKELLKREKAKDQIWDWQPRTWADVMRLFVGTALEYCHSA